MNSLLDQKHYEVRFIAYYGQQISFDVTFECTDEESVKNIIRACAAFNSGDETICRINGEIVVLEGDWGLLL